MITAVSTWKCKCGTRIKVIGETPKDRPSATQVVACPACGDKQTIYGAQILSVTSEKDVHVQDK